MYKEAAEEGKLKSGTLRIEKQKRIRLKSLWLKTVRPINLRLKQVRLKSLRAKNLRPKSVLLMPLRPKSVETKSIRRKVFKARQVRKYLNHTMRSLGFTPQLTLRQIFPLQLNMGLYAVIMSIDGPGTVSLPRTSSCNF
jgi:hypothetical protein